MRGDASSGRDSYASVIERIAWTKGFTVPIDKLVLESLSTFANFKTGIRANMRLELLVERSGIPRRTVQRSLQRLTQEGWIVAHLWHRHPTSYDINLDKLATTWLTPAKVANGLCATDGAQVTNDDEEAPIDLCATSGAQDPDLCATGGAQDPVLCATGGAPIPCTTDPQVQ